MKKLLLPAVLLAVLLSACAPGPGPAAVDSPTPTANPVPTVTTAPSPTPTPTPEPSEEPKELWGFPIDETHDAFEVDTKGKLGTVLVTVEIEDIDPEEYHFSVWTKDNLKTPIQTMTAESYGVSHWKHVADVNFDGHMDFGYMYAMGNQPMYWHYWIWDEDKGLFVQEPEFDQISCPQFDKETGVISGYARGGFAGAAGATTFHRWIDGRLVCIRKITTWPYGVDTLNEIRLTVEEPIDGALTVIYQHETDIGTAFEEAAKWKDLSYHG